MTSAKHEGKKINFKLASKKKENFLGSVLIDVCLRFFAFYVFAKEFYYLVFMFKTKLTYFKILSMFKVAVNLVRNFF
jgi:hypothetical protein